MQAKQNNSKQRLRDTIAAARNGDSASLDVMTDLVYVELKRIAAAHLRRETPGHTLQATALVHEAYLSLADADLSFESRAHFLAIAAKAMRRILVHHARTRNAAKRGGAAQRITFHEDLAALNDGSAEVEALDEALKELERIDPRKSQVIELRFFGGLTEPEAAEVLGISVATVNREMRVARALLLQTMKGEAPPQDGPSGAQSKS